MAAKFAVDHDFPEPILNAVKPFLPIDVEMISRIDKRLIDRLDDWQVILALFQKGYEGLITLDAAMLALPGEVAVIHQTDFTLFAIEAAGNNPLRATGQLFLHISTVGNRHDPSQPRIFRGHARDPSNLSVHGIGLGNWQVVKAPQLSSSLRRHDSPTRI